MCCSGCPPSPVSRLFVLPSSCPAFLRRTTTVGFAPARPSSSAIWQFRASRAAMSVGSFRCLRAISFLRSSTDAFTSLAFAKAALSQKTGSDCAAVGRTLPRGPGRSHQVVLPNRCLTQSAIRVSRTSRSRCLHHLPSTVLYRYYSFADTEMLASAARTAALAAARSSFLTLPCYNPDSCLHSGTPLGCETSSKTFHRHALEVNRTNAQARSAETTTICGKYVSGPRPAGRRARMSRGR